MVGAGQPHYAGWVLDSAIGIAEIKQARLHQRPMGWCYQIGQQPIGMDRFATGIDLDRGLGQSEVLPCGELPITGAIIPFNKEGAAGGDVCIGVAAVIDDDINAAAISLPLLNG